MCIITILIVVKCCLILFCFCFSLSDLSFSLPWDQWTNICFFPIVLGSTFTSAKQKVKKKKNTHPREIEPTSAHQRPPAPTEPSVRPRFRQTTIAQPLLGALDHISGFVAPVGHTSTGGDEVWKSLPVRQTSLPSKHQTFRSPLDGETGRTGPWATWDAGGEPCPRSPAPCQVSPPVGRDPNSAFRGLLG